jgi:hypothetical protein
VRALRIAFVAIAALIFWAGASYADVTVSPSSGPPATVVTVSGITECPGPVQPALFLSWTNSVVPFVPPSPARFTVPDIPEGAYTIVPNCGAMEVFYVFVVTPGFTG